MSHSNNNNNTGNSSANHRRKKYAQRFHDQFEDNDFGLNGQDFGVSQLQQQQHKKKTDVAGATASGTMKDSKSTNNNAAGVTKKKRPQEKQLVATKETLEAFSDDVASLWCGFGTIPVLEEPPSALTFLRDYVSPSRPCIIRNALMVRETYTYQKGDPFPFEQANSGQQEQQHSDEQKEARALQFSLDDLVEMDPDLELMVDASPDGEADVVRTVIDHATGKHHRLFVTPEQRRMTIADFREQLRQGRRQQQRRETGEFSEQTTKAANGESEGQEEENDLEFEEELYDESGKKVFSLKNSKPPQRKKNNTAEEFFENMATCNPSTMMSTPVPTTCNPLNDMEDLIMPCFMELLDNNDPQRYQATEASEGEKPPPPPPPSVLYYSRQNDCFRNEMPSLYAATGRAIPASLEFAEQAFGTGPPEAVNLWMGDERSVSSMHKDPYENLFYVASGEKVFTLCPPSDAPYLYEQDFLSGQFDSQQPRRNQKRHPKKRQWSVKTGYEDGSDGEEEDEDDDDDDIVLNRNHSTGQPQYGLSNDMEPVLPETMNSDEERPAYVRWIEADVAALRDPCYESQQLRKFPLLKYAHPIHEVRIQAGEILYLPALWFHRVTQSRETIGLNFWYNMNFNSPHWCYFQFLQQLQWKAQRQELQGNEEDLAEKKFEM